MKTLRLTLLAVLAVVATGCLAGTGAPANLPNGRPLPAAWKVPDSRVVLEPPGLVNAAVESNAAYALCQSGVADCEPGAPTEIDLALVSDPDFATTDAKGAAKPRLKDTLVWVMVWRSFTCPPAQGPGNDRPQGSADETLCDKVALVDASTGEFVYSYLFPHE